MKTAFILIGNMAECDSIAALPALSQLCLCFLLILSKSALDLMWCRFDKLENGAQGRDMCVALAVELSALDVQ